MPRVPRLIQVALSHVLKRLSPLARGMRLPFLMFAVTCLMMFFVRGVHHGGDTPRYLGGAELFLNGEPLPGRYGTYIGYIVFVALFQALGAGGVGIIVAQVLVSALCVAALYDLGRRVAGETAGVAAACLYAANIDLARFTFSILTDSLFTSGLVLSTYLTYRTVASDLRWAAPAAATVVITASLRPGGSFFVAVFGTALAFAILRERSWLWKGLAAVAVLIGSAWLSASPVRAVFATEDPTQWLVEGTVLIENEAYRMQMPPAADSNGGALSAIGYCSDWPVACARLILRRVGVEFAHTRSFYSFRHNLVILLVFPPLYGLAVIGVWATRRHPLTMLSLAVVGLQAAVTGLTLADWDGRLVLFVFPLITLYSGIGIAVIASRYRARPRRAAA